MKKILLIVLSACSMSMFAKRTAEQKRQTAREYAKVMMEMNFLDCVQRCTFRCSGSSCKHYPEKICKKFCKVTIQYEQDQRS